MVIKGKQTVLKIKLWEGFQTKPPRRKISTFSTSRIHPGQPVEWSSCVVLHLELLFGVNTLTTSFRNTGCQWLRALGTASSEVTGSGGEWPTSSDWGSKGSPPLTQFGQIGRVIPGPELLVELAKGSVLASPCSSSCHSYFLTDVSPNYTLQLTFWMQFAVSESDSREPNQRKFNMWLIPHILKMKG